MPRRPTAQRCPARPWLLALVLAGALLPSTARSQVGAGFAVGGGSLGLGFGANSQHTWFSVAYGRRLVPHLELGLDAAADLRSDGPNVGQAGPYLRAYALTEPPVAPFVQLEAARVFLQGADDGWLLHAGVGLAVFLGPRVYASAEVFREQLRLPDIDPVTSTDYRVGMGLVL